jgi:hypothetical protein
LREQIRVYCLEGIKQLDTQMTEAKEVLENNPQDSTENPIN